VFVRSAETARLLAESLLSLDDEDVLRGRAGEARVQGPELLGRLRVKTERADDPLRGRRRNPPGRTPRSTS
jgi:hypothetical protein